MTFNAAGMALLREFEGCRLEAYQDGGGVWTIGYGHIQGVQPGDKITQEEAEALLAEDAAAHAESVSHMIPSGLTDNQFSAVVCFAFNVGVHNLKQSTLLNCIKHGQWASAAEEFLRWCKVAGTPSAGLLRRREAEKALFLTA